MTVIVLGTIMTLSPALTTLDAQDTQTLIPYTPAEGRIEAGQAGDTWTFDGSEGAVISLYAEGTGDGLDPVLLLTDSAGEVLTYNDDIAYPGSPQALIQAVTLPYTDTYSVTVSDYAQSGGGYRLTLFHGYSQIVQAENFNDTETPWRSADAVLDQAAGQLTLSLAGIAMDGIALNPSAAQTDPADFYAEAVIASASGRNGWIAGLTLRQTGRAYYRLALNADGQWRMTLHTTSGEQVLRDWTSHPAIVAGEERFTLSVLANGGAFDVFYNGRYVGQALDSENTLISGDIGLYAATTDSAGSESQISFDALTVTTPYTLGDSEVLPMQIVAGTQALTIQELERRRIIPTGGTLALTVPESFGQRGTPGVNRVLLGRGTTFGDLVINTTLRWQTAASGVVGCGVIFGSESDSAYLLAYLDQTGGYGVSPLIGETFGAGIFGVLPAWSAEIAASAHHLLVIRRGDMVHYYVNRQYMGTARDLPTQPGEIGVAVVNYETIDTTCEFSDTWVWRLD